jgi:hypothetical protein
MSKVILTSMMGLLAAAGLVRGQSPDAPAQPPGEGAQAPPAEVMEGPPSPFCSTTVPSTSAGFSAGGEYLLWWLFTRRNTVPLAATASLGGGGSVLDRVGEENVDRNNPYSGGRFTLSYWLTNDDPWAKRANVPLLRAETSFFFLGQRSAAFNDELSTTLVRPFFDFNNRTESAVIVAFPGLATGSLAASVKTDLWGAEANVWTNIYYNRPGTTCSVEVMGGFRFLQLNDDIQIARTSLFAQNLQSFPAFLPFAGNTIAESELFATHNSFYGGQVGVTGKLLTGTAIMEAGLKLAVGATHEEVHIDGRQLRTTPDGRTTALQGALLALPSNIGRFHRDKFSQIPEADLSVTVPMGHHFTFTLGFTALYWSRIVRAAEQIDRVVDITQIPNFPAAASAVPTGARRPGVPFEQTHLFVTGLNAGVAIVW